MPKNVFWPATLVIMGFIFLASNMGLLPNEFWNFWPLILIVVGLGGLLTSDRDEWMIDTTKKPKAVSKAKAKTKAKTKSASKKKSAPKKKK